MAAVRNCLDVAGVEALIDAHFPQIHFDGRIMVIEDVAPHGTRVRMKWHERNLRPGGTISGPALFTLADFAVYAAVIGALGEAGIGAVTTSLNITFLAKPEARDVVASVRLVRLEHRLAVGEVELYSDGVPGMVAHAVATYALPADARRAGQD